MKRTPKAIIILLITIIFIGCAPNDNNKIIDTITVFYKNYKGNFREAPQKALTASLADKINQTIEFEKKSAELTKKSNFPTDKPQIIEGDIFSGLYEGYTSFKIKEVIKIENSRSATVSIEFSNSNYNKKWTEQIVLINDNGWKIDDVIYLTESVHNKSLKVMLTEFIKLPPTS